MGMAARAMGIVTGRVTAIIIAVTRDIAGIDVMAMGIAAIIPMKERVADQYFDPLRWLGRMIKRS